jgi:hypothetical protein
MRTLVLLLLTLLTATSGFSEEFSRQPESIPAPGTLEWVQALNAAAEGFHKETRNPRELLDQYRPILALYQGCTACKKQTYRQLEHLLQVRFHDKPTLLDVQQVEFADDPASLGRVLVKAGQPRKAKAVVRQALKHEEFVESRLKLLEVLAGAQADLGALRQARSLAKRLLAETPVSRDYCEQALKWRMWLGESPLPDETILDPRSYATKIESVRQLERERGNDPYVSCLYAHYLQSLDRYLEGMKGVGVRKEESAQSLFPDGIEAPLLELARRTPDPKVRASLLLNVAFSMLTKDRVKGLSLVREAKAAGAAPSIQVGTRRMELSFIDFQAHREEGERNALELIDHFQEYEASCEACALYWSVLNFPWPEYSNRIPEWRKKCRGLLERCPNRTEAWTSISYSFGTGNENAREVYEGLLATDPPDSVLPIVLLRLSDAIRPVDPARAWQLERRAIRNPEYPGLYRSEDRGGSLEHAESNGDFETALFLYSFPRGIPMGDCIPGHKSPDPYQFLLAYFRLRVGIDVSDNWNKMLGQLPASPENENAEFFHSPKFLDRLVKAAQSAHTEIGAQEWLRTLLDRYNEVLEQPVSDKSKGMPQTKLHEVQSSLIRYIKELEGPPAQSGDAIR